MASQNGGDFALTTDESKTQGATIRRETKSLTFTTHEHPARLLKQNFEKFHRFHACRRHPLFGRYSNCAVSKIRSDILGSSSFGSSPYPVSLAWHLSTPRSWKDA